MNSALSDEFAHAGRVFRIFPENSRKRFSLFLRTRNAQKISAANTRSPYQKGGDPGVNKDRTEFLSKSMPHFLKIEKYTLPNI